MSDSSWSTVAMPAAAASTGVERQVRPAAAAVIAARVRGARPRQDPDEGALAGPVLTEDGMHFAGSRGEVHLVEGDDAAKALADGLRLEQRRDRPSGPFSSDAGSFLGGDVEPVRARRQDQAGRQVGEDVLADLELLEVEPSG